METQTDVLQIPTIEDYKAISDKNVRNQLLRDLRGIYSDKDIRDKWGLKYNSFYYYLTQLKDEEAQWAAAGGRPALGSERNSTKQHTKETGKKTGKKTTPKRQVIDADFSVVEEKYEEKYYPAMTQQQQQETRVESSDLPLMNFVNVVGDIKQLDKRLSAILTLLEMEGEEARFRLNIQVYKA